MPPLPPADEDSALIVVKRHGELMDRVATILDQARTNVVRAVNSNMVIAYWLSRREIVQVLKGGEERAGCLPNCPSRCSGVAGGGSR